MFIIDANSQNFVVNVNHVVRFLLSERSVIAYLDNNDSVLLGVYPNLTMAEVAYNELIDALRYNDVMIYRMPTSEEIYDIVGDGGDELEEVE